MKRENFTAFFLMALLMAGAIAACLAYPEAARAIKRTTWEDFLTGKTATTFEDEFDKQLPHYDFSVNTWNRIDYTLFREGNPGVLVGDDGWLFTAEEFYGGADFEKNFTDNINYIDYIHTYLRRKNIALLVVPVPAKARIYADRLGRYEYPHHWHDNYRRFMEALDEYAIPHVDLLDAFHENKNKEPLFLRTDTHWSPAAARMTAHIVVARIAKDYPYLDYPTREYKVVERVNDVYYGDLMSFVANDAFGVKPEMFKAYALEGVTPGKNAAQDLYVGEYLPIVLAGTSYSANPDWGFEYYLKEALKGDILNVSAEGIGPFYMMRNYMSSQAFIDQPPKLIIWEMPERYMSTPLPLELQR